MALPSVNVSVTNENFVITKSEDSSEYLAGILLPDNTELINAVGTTGEVTEKFMTVNSLEDWWGRLSSNLGNSSGIDFDGFSAGTIATIDGESRWPSGPTGNWKNQWWTCQNYLRYGGRAVIGVSSAAPFTSNNTHNLNTGFCTESGSSGDLSTILTTRDNDFLGIFKIEDVTSGVPAGANSNKIYVFGSKLVIPIGDDPSNVVNDSDYIEIGLDSDVAGCLARTARVSNVWDAPAGMKRGQIVDGDNLKTPLTAVQATNLYNNRINPVLGFPESGTVLFGNKTGATAGSIDDRIEVSSLIVFLKREIGLFAKEVLFERNNTASRQSFVNRATSVLDEVKSQGGVSDFSVICDETNNTDSSIAQGNFVADIFIKPFKSVEFLKISFTNKNQDTNIT